MSRIEKKFAQLKRARKKALIVFVTAGDPNLKTTELLVPKLFEAGADIVELGVPFSDPLADGPTIQASYIRALKKGVSLKKIISMIGRLRKRCDEPLVVMSAYNLIHSFGDGAFLKAAGGAGVDGVIFPDLIPDEAGHLLPKMKKAGIDPIFLVAPTTGKDRIKLITGSCRGFVYYISVSGVTGKQKPSPADIERQVTRIRKVSKLPVACGFGIKTAKQAARISRITDGVIMGSALVDILSRPDPITKKLNDVLKLVKKVRNEMDR